MERAFDVVVIGSGPAGEKGAIEAAKLGKRVALVEKGPLGGACRNTGTIPSKTLRESALYLSGLMQREIYGVQVACHTENIGVRDFMRHKERVCHDEGERIQRDLARHLVELIPGHATVETAHTLRVRHPGQPDRVLETEFVLVATGTYPFRPPEIPFEDPDVDDSDEVLEVPSIPKTFVVVGGGVIGCEYASIYAALGITKVTLIERGDRLLSFLDNEIGDALTDAFRRLGIEVILNDSVTEFGKRADGTGVKIKLASGRVMEVDRLLAASGRSGNTRGMGLAEAGVQLSNRGIIKVNANFQSSVPTIYAAGDVVGFPALAATGMEQGRLAMDHAFGRKRQRKIAELFPYGIYTIPEVSCVGLSEEAARKKYDDVEVGRGRYSENVRGQIINDANGMLKIVFRAHDRKLLGVHIMGERATELIHIGQAVLALGGTLDYFLDFVFNYPTLTETYKIAAYDGVSRMDRETF